MSLNVNNKGVNTSINSNKNSKPEFKTNKTLTLQEKSNTIRAKENYHIQGLTQAKIGFYFSIIGAGLGLLVIIISLFFCSDKSWGIISGCIIDAVSLLIFHISDNAIRKMGEFFDKLGDDSNKMKAIDLVREIENRSIRDQVSVKLALFLAGLSEEKICKNTKEACNIENKDIQIR